jgi:hypothetical protein
MRGQQNPSVCQIVWERLEGRLNEVYAKGALT